MVVLEKRLRSGREVPELEDEPYLPQGLSGMWNAYVSLDLCRPFHEKAMVPVPMTEIEAYLNILGYEGADEREYFMRVIQMVDAHAVKKANEKKSKGASRSKGKDAGKGKAVGRA